MSKDKNHEAKTIAPISNDSIPDILSMLPVFTGPIFPGVMIPISISHENLYPELDKELRPNQFIGIFLVKKRYEHEPIYNISIDMVYKVGTIARIIKKVYLPNGSMNILTNCLHRVEIEHSTGSKALLQVKVKKVKEKEDKNDLETKVLLKTISEQIEYIAKNNPFMAEQIKMAIQDSDSPSRITDFIASILGDVPKEKLQNILETTNVRSRLEKIAILMEERLTMIKLQEKIMNQINEKTEKQQREFFLREQLKSIKEELGLETDAKTVTLEKFSKRLKEITPSIENKEVIETLTQELDKFANTESRSPDYSTLLNYLEITLFLPWVERVLKPINLKKSHKILEDSHYGIQDVKDRIMEFLAVQQIKPDSKGSVICFVGPPGVGKTSLGKAIAAALNRPFFRFSVGGMRDEAEIKGHRRTYVSSMPGKIVQGLKISKVDNPVFMIDEIDKIGASYQGDPAAALLEVLDPEQNINFRDHYLDLPINLSNVLFITTANTLATIPDPLLDRMEIIQLTGYIAEEKYMIGKTYLLDKQKKANGLEPDELSLSKKAFLYIIENYSRESGIRNFERQIAKLCRKIAYKKAIGDKFKTQVETEDLHQYLGPEIFNQETKKLIRRPGISIGLAWTNMGGDTLYIESIIFPSKNSNLKLTGQLGNIMQESAEIAYTYLQSIAKKHDINPSIFSNHTIHLHVPAGAVPKDGPSAGITIATALYSLLKKIKVPQNFAMTGELTLTGRVLGIGGLKEKSTAAVRAGIKNIIAPLDNKKDLEEIPELITKHLTYYFIADWEEVIDILFK